MPFDFQRARPLLQSCNLTELFVEELGWEPCHLNLTLRAADTDFALKAIAEKKGFTAWLCACNDGTLPDHNTRLKLDRALAQTSFEHLIVFATADLARQSWVWVRREPGRPLSAKTHDFTPDVIGKRESLHSDIVKGPIEIVSAEIKTDTLQLITAFGQACAYRIFSHKVYLAVPNTSSEEDLDRLDSLCMIYGIGLVTFAATNPKAPDFRIMTRAARHEPDLFYTNKYMALIEKDLFS